MYDDSDGEVPVFDFDEMADQLVEQGLQSSPSEMHGCFCGLLAAGAARQGEVGLDALAQALELVLHGELAENAMQLYAVTASSLEDEEFDFHPLLPGDEDDVAERVIALASWCGGFLAGFAHETARANRGDAALPGDSSEILRDFAAIAQAEQDEDALDEELEASYTELVEYLRFATLNIYTDSCGGEKDPESSPGRGPAVH